MISNELECDKLNKFNNILHRSSLRGLKKCGSCGSISGQRALICRNTECDLRKCMLASIKPFDPIQLVTHNDVRLFSVRTKEKIVNVRNFVAISQSPSTGIFSRKATCYVDGCKNEAPTDFHCQHIKAIYSVDTDFQLAEVYQLDKNVLWNLNVSEEQKTKLWDSYCRGENEENIPPIQRLNGQTFAVTSLNSNNFLAGRLHVTVCSDAVTNKKGFYLCACKKLKIVVEPDNSVTMKKEICDHLLLLLAAILNRPDKSMYSAFLDALQHLWMPTTLNPPVDSSSSPLTDFDMPMIDCDDKNEVNPIGKSNNSNTEDFFNFNEDLFAENTIPDFSDMLSDMETEAKKTSSSCMQQQYLPIVSTSDPHFNSNNSVEDFDINFPHIKQNRIADSVTSPSNISPNSNFNVVEQFQLSNDIQLSCDNIVLAQEIESLNNIESQAQESCLDTTQLNGIEQIKKEPNTPTVNDLQKATTNFVANTSNSVIIKPKCKPVFLNKSVIVKQSPVKIIKITKPGVIQKLPTIDKKFVQISKIDSSKIIVLNTKSSQKPINIQPISNVTVTSTVPSPPLMDASQPSSMAPALSYESWLDHIIEILNDSIILQDSNNIKHTFHVHEDMFSHFSKTFGFNNKPRLPSFTQVLTSGKHKGLIKYGWYFNQAAAVKRIFSTKNSKLELQRPTEPLKDGNFVPFFSKISSQITVTKCRPKEPEQRVFLKFSNAPETASDTYENDKSGLKLEWLPSAFPRSHFGLMTIEFCVYTYSKNGSIYGNL
ncbi:uncharacterized protein LOC131803767 [Musca domestica]|uniref:Uncharacterized protein LOC131803767 n=1 Tax=Musca domestica TaxID=7370 RepID=A0ABM3V6M2_MUSDO|nr:uncharacterized protein LOC131803767 [Musca domestica]